MRYNSPELTQLGIITGTGQMVHVRYDPTDLGQVHVSTGSGDGERTWLVVPAVDKAYAGNLSVWAHRARERHFWGAQQPVDVNDMNEIRLRIQQIAQQEDDSLRSRKNLRSSNDKRGIHTAMSMTNTSNQWQSAQKLKAPALSGPRTHRTVKVLLQSEQDRKAILAVNVDERRRRLLQPYLLRI